jgi:hypothetical protein
MTIFLMFFIELMVARFDVFGDHEHDLEAAGTTTDSTRQNEKYLDWSASQSKVDLSCNRSQLLSSRF